MSTHPDARRSIATWLDSEAPDRAPTRLIEASRERVRVTSQRRAWWPAWAGSDMNLYARLGVTAVAVAAISVVALTIVRPSVGPAGGLGIFTPVAGRILSGLWAVNPTAVDPTNPSRSAQLRLGPDESLPLGWSRDGTRLLLLREDPADETFPFARQLFVLRADGTEVQLSGEGTDVGGAAISPDGSRVVFAADGLFVVDAGGGQAVRIAEEGSSPTYSPDGSQIAYVAGNAGPGGTSVWVIDADGTDAHAILADEAALGEGADDHLKWSPAGDRLTIANSLEGQAAIYTFAPDGSEFTKVITGGINPFWSPDGSQIAYLVPYDAPPGAGSPGLAIADADGSNVRQFGFAASGPWHPGPLEADAEPSASPSVSRTPGETNGPTAEPPSSSSSWPQSSPDDVRAAQELANAGDPDYTWQVDPGLLSAEWWAYIQAGGVDIVERFLRDELGWEQFAFNPFLPSEYPTEDGVLRVVYIRCEPGGTNALYRTFPDGHNEAPGAESCAPTLDELRYETVSLDIAQPGEKGATGIWVVSRWTLTPPFAQADPVASEAQATALLEEFLAARVAGRGAEGYVDLTGFGVAGEVPLLYATTTGAAYERFEFERVRGPEWPYARIGFEVRLFADGGATVVEQQISWDGSGLSHRPTEGTENGEPVAAAYAFFDGLITFSAADPWHVGLERSAMELGDQSSEAIVLVADPHAVGGGCANRPAAADSDALAGSLLADPDLEVTAPLALTPGGVRALRMDVGLAPGAGDCAGSRPVVRPADGSDRNAANLDRGTRMRLYLIDLPEGSASRIMAIAVVAPEARFETVLDAATPVLESIAFPAGGGDR